MFKFNRIHTLQVALLAAIASFIYVIFSVYAGFDKEHSVDMIPFYTALLTSIIAFGGLCYVTIENLNYRWKRDQTLKDIERIYEPCYEEICTIIESLKNYRGSIDYKDGWRTIRQNYLAKILQLKNKGLYDELEEFYTPIYNKNYWDNLGKGKEIVKDIFLKEIKKGWHDKDSADRDLEIQERIFEKLDYDGKIVYGFIKGLNIKEISKKTTGHEYWIVSKIEPEITKEYKNYFTFSPKIFDDVQKEIEANPEIKKIRKTQEELIKQAEEIKRILEGEIVKPQI